MAYFAKPTCKTESQSGVSYSYIQMYVCFIISESSLNSVRKTFSLWKSTTKTRNWAILKLRDVETIQLLGANHFYVRIDDLHVKVRFEKYKNFGH